MQKSPIESPPFGPEPELLTAVQTAAKLGVHPSVIRKWAVKKKIPRIVITERSHRYIWAEVVEALRALK